MNARRDDEALAQLNKTIGMDQNFAGTKVILPPCIATRAIIISASMR
jgi:hypothetical protein